MPIGVMMHAEPSGTGYVCKAKPPTGLTNDYLQSKGLWKVGNRLLETSNNMMQGENMNWELKTAGPHPECKAFV